MFLQFFVSMMGDSMEKIDVLIERFNQGDRNALAKLITIIESTAETSRTDKERIFLGVNKKHVDSLRIAISGPPGVGKSTFINTLGKKLIDKGHRVAVLPIDPSSEVSGGSLLADKTRMKDLVLLEQAYIRPSPSHGTLGGVAVATSDVIFLVEAFGFDVVIIETVGVGQSETKVSLLADHFVLLMQPGAGDQLQAMKKGIVEKADFILINKADGELQKLALQTKRELKSSRVGSVNDQAIYIASVSALADEGVEQFVDNLFLRHEQLLKSGALWEKRSAQSKKYFYHLFDKMIAERIRQVAPINAAITKILNDVHRKNEPLSTAVNHLAEMICNKLAK